MPLLPAPAFLPSLLFRSGHIQTIYPTLFRPHPAASPRAERLITPDDDFIDIDWHKAEGTASNRLAVVSHGLEGNSRKKYPLGMARHLTTLGWDVICLNFRGCSGEPNRRIRFYHSGVTDDLHTVLTHALGVGGYDSAVLIGFSMGGNQTLKYLGEDPAKVPEQVRAAVVFSVPCDLAASAKVLARPVNSLYMQYFMKGLREKIITKATLFPGQIDTKGLLLMRSFIPFDDKYTAPIHGFADAADYYNRCSSRQFLSAIRVPTLLVQAANDPFLPDSCYPRQEAADSAYLYLEIPRYGGHVGFLGAYNDNPYWSEVRAGMFVKDFCQAGVSSAIW